MFPRQAALRSVLLFLLTPLTLIGFAGGSIMLLNAGSSQFQRPVDPDPAPVPGSPPTLPRLMFGPVAGFTTTAFPVSTDLALPVRQAVTFTVADLGPGRQVLWSLDGLQSAQGPQATYRFDRAAASTVSALVQPDGIRLAVGLTSLRLAPRDLRFEYRIETEAPSALRESASNEEAIGAFLKESTVAGLTTVVVGHMATSIDQHLRLVASASGDDLPRGLSSLIEWRVDGLAIGVGEARLASGSSPADHVIEVGPPQSAAHIDLTTYSVEITSPGSTAAVPEGRTVVFQARTSPPGYEPFVTWLAATLNGSAEPTLGRGNEFSTTFLERAGGPGSVVATECWGVRADNAALGVDQVMLLRGFHLLQGSGSVALSLPADFFATGSQAFTGTVQLVGSHLGTRGAFELGTTDAVLERLDPVLFLPTVSRIEIPVEFVELSLLGSQPITVMVNGTPQQWNVTVGINPAATEIEGLMTLVRSGSDQGTVSFSIPLPLLFTFERQGVTRTKATDPGETLVGSGGSWVPASICPSRPLDVPQLPTGPCLTSLSLDGPTVHLLLQAASPDSSRPPALVDPGAVVDPAVASLGRNAVVSSGATIGTGAVIGPGAFIGPGATVGPWALVGANAFVGSSSLVDTWAIVDDGTDLGSNVQIGTRSLVGPDSNVAAGVVIGSDTTIGGASAIGTGAHLGSSVKGQRLLVIGPNSTVPNGLYLTAGASVPGGATQSQSLRTCMLTNGSTFIGTTQACAASSGTVRECVSEPNKASLRNKKKKELTPGDPNHADPNLPNLGTDIDAHVAPPSNGGMGQPYTDTTHDCDDFADELERLLQGKGYNATFTIIYYDVDNPDHHWYNWLWTSGKIREGHCLTDVRQTDGTILWLEAQFTSPAALGVNLDGNGDGKVTVADRPGTANTDGNMRIEVYESMQDAIDKGAVLD